jgi:hypothetical protein
MDHQSAKLVGNGQNTRFWEDTWLGDISLCEQYPSLYRIVNLTGVTLWV